MPDEIYPPATGKLKAGKAFADSPTWQAWVAKLKTGLEQGARDWEARYGTAYPESVEDLQRLLVRAGVDANRVLAGDIALAEAAAVVRGYLERLRDNAAASPATATLKGGAAQEYPEAVYRFLQRLEATINEARARGARDGWVPHVPGTRADEDAWRVAGHAGLVAHISGSDALQPAGRAALARWRLEAANVPTGEPTPPAKADAPTHSPDFTSVDWGGERYTFSKGQQAAAVRVLWEAGGHSLTQETIGERVGSDATRFRLAKLFHGHRAWGTMIVPDGKGCYRIPR